MHRILSTLTALALLIASPALAEAAAQGWGPRVGLTSGPDQVIFGAHFDFGHLGRDLDFRPNVHLGVGDNITTLSAAGDVFYRFSLSETSWRPYAGGSLGLLYMNFDSQFVDSSRSDLQLMVLGGLEGRLPGGTRMLVELKFELVDAPDLTLLTGWTF